MQDRNDKTSSDEPSIQVTLIVGVLFIVLFIILLSVPFPG